MRRFFTIVIFALVATALAEEQEQQAEEPVFTADQMKAIEAAREKHEFKAEVNRLMNILVNSLYTNKEIFLRELISNANDAIEKLRFLSLTNKSAMQPESLGLEISVRAHREDGTLRIRDTGIGMTRDELVLNLGTIAQSGTVEFVQKMTAAAAAGEKNGGETFSSLIGQFGVGFYSSFLTADRVTVVSKSNDDAVQHVWESDASGSFTVAPDPRGNTLGRGTEIILHMKEAEKERFLDEKNLAEIITKYAEFINFPVRLWCSHEVDRVVEIPAEEQAAAEKPDEKEEEEVLDKDEQGEEVVEEKKQEQAPKTKTIKVQEWAWKVMNDIKPIWVRKSKDITEEEYTAFYKAITKDQEEPMAHVHFSAEGDANFRALLYVPKHAPANLWDPSPASHKHDVRLFVKHVFVTGDFFEVVPQWLRFVRGVVDSEDLPINVGREQVQESKALDAIKQKLTRKSIGMIQEMFKQERDGKYKEFYTEYQAALKLGVIDDTNNRERLSKLLLFHSSVVGENKTTSFEEYIERMEAANKARDTPQKQNEILYIAGESLAAIVKSPLLERLIRNGYEVLYLVDPIDEYLCQNLWQYDKRPMTNIGRDGLKLEFLPDEPREMLTSDAVVQLSMWFVSLLGDAIEKVVPSTKLMTSPAAVVSGPWGPTANMERISKAQALSQPQGKVMFQPKRVLEINPSHPIIMEIHRRLHDVGGNEELAALGKLLYHTALLSSGYTVDDTPSFTSEIYTVMAAKLGVGTDINIQKAPNPEAQPPKEEQKEL